MKFEIRKAEYTDKNRIRELFILMLKTIYNTEEVEEYEEGYLEKYFSGNDDVILVAESQNIVIGYLSVEVHREENEFIYLDDFSIEEEFRGKGIGSQLLKKAEEYAEKLRIDTICLHVEKDNKSAFKLYERNGYFIFEDCGNRNLLMKKLN